MILILLFVILPLVELMLLIEVGSVVGAWHTILLIILTGILGASLARYQGLRVLFEIQRDLGQGIMPTDRLIDGVMILAAGIVLLTPGFITDALGFFVLIPQGRRLLKNWVKNFFQKRARDASGVIDVEHYE